MTKYFKIILRRETIAPMAALGFASLISVGLVAARILWTGHLRYGFLVWNLFLAWLPLIFALLTCHELQEKIRRRWLIFGMAGAWLLFFPNAPYIFTDLIHLQSGFFSYFWVDLTLILICALTGLVLGFVSLYLMQSVVRKRFGWAAGWLFSAGVVGLSSFGVYLGRFLRFNSWDVILRPGRMYHRLDAWLEGPMVSASSGAFLVLFATFLFIAYVMLYALTHLSPAQATSSAGTQAMEGA